MIEAQKQLDILILYLNLEVQLLNNHHQRLNGAQM